MGDGGLDGRGGEQEREKDGRKKRKTMYALAEDKTKKLGADYQNPAVWKRNQGWTRQVEIGCCLVVGGWARVSLVAAMRTVSSAA